MKHTPWRTGRDLFGAIHVYDSGGYRLTNDHLTDLDEWPEIARLIAAAPELLSLVIDAVEDESEFQTEWNKAAREIIKKAT